MADPNEAIWAIQDEEQKKFQDASNAKAGKKFTAACTPDGLLKVEKKALRLLRVVASNQQKFTAIAWRDTHDPVKCNHLIAACNPAVGLCQVYDCKTNKMIMAFKKTFTEAVSLHPNEDLACVGGMENTIYMYKNKGGAEDGNCDQVGMLEGHDGYVKCLKFVNEGANMLSTGGDGMIMMWDLKKKQCVHTFYGHEPTSQSEGTCDIAQISLPKGVKNPNNFCTASLDKTVRVWDIREKKCVISMQGEAKLNTCDYFPDGNFIAAGGDPLKNKDSMVSLFDVRAGKICHKYQRNGQIIQGIQFSLSGRSLYVAYEDGSVGIWDSCSSGGNREYAHKHIAHQPAGGQVDVTVSRISGMELNPTGSVLATASFDGSIKVWGPPAVEA